MKNKYILLGDGRSPHILKWIKELDKYFNLYFISLNGIDKKIYEYIDENKIYILNNHTNSLGGNYKLIFNLFKIKKIFKDINPDYINAHYLSSYGVLASLTKKSVPHAVLIQSTWGSDILITPFTNFIRKKVAQYALNKADYITSDSWDMSDVIKKLVKNKEIIIFPFGLENISPISMHKENIVFSNRALKPLYNIYKIIKWFKNQNQDYQLIIANDGNERSNLEALVFELNLSHRVSFVGFLSPHEQIKYYKKAKYYISIPSSDATSVSLLEAMQYGMLPIVSNISANREWIVDSINGSYFDKNQDLDTIKIEENFDKINFNLLKNKAIFSKSIKNFISKVR
jgi:glycosyltransferase involved in cell wall biosynthesis